MVSANGQPTTGARKTSKRASRLRFEILNAFVDRSMAMLSRGELPPPEFSRPEVAEILIRGMRAQES